MPVHDEQEIQSFDPVFERAARRRAPSRRFSMPSPAMALFPLRLFLGVTFVYAGIQKLSDPGFLHPGAPTYIGTQLHGFAAGTPGGFLLRAFALPHPELAGIGVAITEILIGLLVTTGLFTRVAAAGGLCLNLILFFTASWHTTPYFLGPDLVFAFAWLPIALAGATGQPALDNLSREPRFADRSRPGAPRTERERDRVPDTAGASTRRVLLAELAGAAVAIAGASALLKGTYSAARTLGATSGPKSGAKASAGHRPSAGGGGSNGASSAGPPAPSQVPSLPSGAVKLGPGKRLPAGAAATYPDPVDGSADIVIRDSAGNLKAFSAVCTHAGCTVGYESGVIVCPCHGGEYSAESGAVIAGPPPAPLAPKQVLEAGGQIYAVPS
jgi:thiosulfate dehydrogenase (quinone) large subunit